MRYNVGVRYVQTDQSVTSRITVPDSAQPQRRPERATAALPGHRQPCRRVETDYENWLPSAQPGLERHRQRDRARRSVADHDARESDGHAAGAGDPQRRCFAGRSRAIRISSRYLSDNIDLGFEYYTGDEGYFGVAAFRKGIEGLHARGRPQRARSAISRNTASRCDSLSRQQQATRSTRRGGNSAIVALNQTVNASGRLTINGLEFNWVQPLDFLLDRFGLDGLGFTANYTIIDQKGEGAAPAIAIGVPPETLQRHALLREPRRERARVGDQRRARRPGPNSNQQGVIGAELFGDDYTAVGLLVQLRLRRDVRLDPWVPQLTVDVINITEEERRSYSQFTNATFTGSIRAGRSWSACAASSETFVSAASHERGAALGDIRLLDALRTLLRDPLFASAVRCAAKSSLRNRR